MSSYSQIQLNRSAREVVVEHLAVGVIDESGHEIEEAEHGPGDDAGSLRLVHHVGNDGENSQREEREADRELQRGFAGHPAIGMSVDVEVRGHASGELIPGHPVTQAR